MNKSIQHNTNWLLLANSIVKPFWFIFLIISTRILGPDDFGIFMYSLSVIGILFSFFEFGVEILSTKVISSIKDSRENFIRYAFGLRLISFLIAFLTLFILYSATSFLDNQIIVFTLFLYGASNSLTIFFRSIFRGYEIMKYEGLSIIFDRVIVILLCGSVLLFSPSLFTFVLSYTLAFFLSMLFTFYFLRKHTHYTSPSFDLNKIKEYVLVPGSVFAVMNILLIIRSRLPSLLIDWITDSNTYIGFYNAGYRLLESYLLIPIIFITPLYPVFVRLFKRKKILTKLVVNSTRLIIVITSFVAIPIYFFAEQITYLLYGEEFLGASNTIALLVLNMFAMALTVVFGSLVSATDRQKRANKLIAIETLFGIFVFFIAVKNLQIEGAAYATIIMESLMALILIYISFNLIDGQKLLRLFTKLGVVIFGSFLSIFLLLKASVFTTIYPNILLAVLIIFTLHLIMGTIKKEDINKVYYALTSRIF